MDYNIYCIRDKKSVFMTPTIDLNDESAKRNFAYALQHSDGIMSFMPSDFELYCLGSFDSNSGKLRPLDVPELVIDGVSLEVFNNERT